MTDLDELRDDPVLRSRVTNHLERLAVMADVRRTPVETIARRAATRRRRQRMAGAMGAVAVVVGATAAALAATHTHRTIAPQDTPAVSAPSTSASSTSESATSVAAPPSSNPGPASTAPSAAGPSSTSATTTTSVPSLRIEGAGHRWGRAAVDDTAEFVLDESEAIVFDSDPDVTWTVSDDPAVGPTIWFTDDGVSWRQAPTAPGVDPVGVVRGGSVIDVAGWSIAPTASGFEVATSVDGGATWSTRRVPLPATARRLVTSDAASVDLARLGDTVVVTVPDLVEADGLDDPQMFAAVGGGAFARVALPADVPAQGAFELEPVTGALLATAYGTVDQAWHLLRSDDGLTWTHLGRLPYTQGQVGTVAGRYVALSSNATADDADLWTSDDGATWTPQRLADQRADGLDWAATPYGWVFDDAGLTLVATAYSEAPVQLRLSERGVTMLFDAGLNDIDMIDDATGATIGGYHDDEYTGRVRLVDGPTLEVFDTDGTVLAEFTLAEASASIAAAPQQTGSAAVAVFHTVDARSWSSASIAALFDQPAPFVASAGSIGGQVVFRFPDGGGDGHQVVLGTPV